MDAPAATFIVYCDKPIAEETQAGSVQSHEQLLALVAQQAPAPVVVVQAPQAPPPAPPPQPPRPGVVAPHPHQPPAMFPLAKDPDER